MTKKFKLKLTIEGSSLDEVDNGLIEAAGERLQARIQQKAGQGILPGNAVLPKGLTIKESVPMQPMVKLAPEAKAAVEAVKQLEQSLPEKRKPGRPKGWTKNGTQKSQETQNASQTPRSNEAKEIETEKEEKVETSKTVSTDPVPSSEKVVAALTKVNSKFGIAKARECLLKFNVQRARDLADEVKNDFVKHCEAMVG